MGTTITRCILRAGAWAPRHRAGVAVMPIEVGVQGATESLVPDLAHELVRMLPWAEYGATVVPRDSLPEGVIKTLPYGGIGIELDENQNIPDYEDGNPDPGFAEVRVRIVQRITGDFEDHDLLLERRIDVRRALGRMTGEIPAPPPPAPSVLPIWARWGVATPDATAAYVMAGDATVEDGIVITLTPETFAAAVRLYILLPTAFLPLTSRPALSSIFGGMSMEDAGAGHDVSGTDYTLLRSNDLNKVIATWPATLSIPHSG